MTTVTLPHRPPTATERALATGPGTDTPRPLPRPRPTWTYGAGAVRRAVAELWEPHLTPGELERLVPSAEERDRGLPDVY